MSHALSFVDREQEMQYLEREYSRAEASLVIVYGRRRVGKTELINEFCKGKPSLYFLATEEMETETRNAFRLEVASFCNDEVLQVASVNDWLPIFKRLSQAAGEERIVLVIDEFQYLGKTNQAFPSIMAKAWDTLFKHKNIMVILCGSLITLMEEQTLSYKSPLYGRRTGQIKLKQVPFRYYHEFFPEIKDPVQLIKRYAVTGGVPKYIELFTGDADIFNSIEQNVISKQSYLYEEPIFLLQNEVREIGSYFSVVRAIAAGNQKMGHIASVLEMKASGLTKYLQTLIDLDILEREVPITELKPENSKRGLYKIKDNFILFWLRFVYPNRSFIESGHPEIAMQRIRKNMDNNHTAYVYEDICREHLWSINGVGQLPFDFDRVGRWWGAGDVEIDLVAIDSNDQNNILFGECKFTTEPMGVDVLANLRKKATKVSWGPKERNESFILFSINGFSPALRDIAEKDKSVILSELP